MFLEAGRHTGGLRFLTMAFCAVAIGCGGEPGPTTPSSAALDRLDGQWGGTTSQGRPIAFVVSPDRKVTSITVEYGFGGCAGVNTFSNLNVAIEEPRTPIGALPPGFEYGSGPPSEPPPSCDLSLQPTREYHLVNNPRNARAD